MEKLKKFARFLKSKYDLLTIKKYTTFAGTLVFFLIMSIVPLTFWLTLLIGKLPVDLEGIFRLAVFDSVKNILSYVRQEAQNATTGASVILLLTTLYSSTNLFYQMRKSGELIYDYKRPKKGLKLRLGALVLMLIVMLLIIVFLENIEAVEVIDLFFRLRGIVGAKLQHDLVSFRSEGLDLFLFEQVHQVGIMLDALRFGVPRHGEDDRCKDQQQQDIKPYVAGAVAFRIQIRSHPF